MLPYTPEPMEPRPPKVRKKGKKRTDRPKAKAAR